ncbi:MAG: endolytic transglycosylase MltG [Gammaproteobacteria bacterium]|nr:endolytic transglycosylase MltG [Gammaproteobacteria bacterium]
MIKKLLIGAVVLLLAAGVIGWQRYQDFLQQTLDFEPDKRVFVLEKGWSARRLGAELRDAGILKDTFWFDLYLRLSGQSSRLQAGEYQLESGLTPPAMVALFINGQVTQYRFTIIEGWDFRRLRAEIAATDKLLHTIEALSDEDIMRELDAEGLHPEGQFLPDTYSFPKGMTDIALLKKAHQALQQTLDSEWQSRAGNIPLKNAYEALILASIIEKETAVADERKKIAGVFSLRLQKDMKLQTDPTVIYGIGEAYDGNIRRRDLQTDTPYNTYTRKGLPPTPIAMAGRESIHAAVHPDEGPELFFVSRGDGTHQFSVTVQEHNAAVKKYQLKK